MTTGRLNLQAQRTHVAPTVIGSQVIEFSCDLKDLGASSQSSEESGYGTQPVEITCDLKDSKRGQHRKYAVNAYTLADAKALLPAGDPNNLADLLTRAFGVVIDTIDTNPYRRTQRELSVQLEDATNTYKDADAGVKHWSAECDGLVAESREAEENQVAYETFAARADQFQPEHKNQPRAAKEWGFKQLTSDRKTLSDHNDRVASLTLISMNLGQHTWC